MVGAPNKTQPGSPPPSMPQTKPVASKYRRRSLDSRDHNSHSTRRPRTSSPRSPSRNDSTLLSARSNKSLAATRDKNGSPPPGQPSSGHAVLIVLKTFDPVDESLSPGPRSAPLTYTRSRSPRTFLPDGTKWN